MAREQSSSTVGRVARIHRSRSNRRPFHVKRTSRSWSVEKNLSATTPRVEVLQGAHVLLRAADVGIGTNSILFAATDATDLSPARKLELEGRPC
jgi:hypothetical protein